MNRDKNNEYIHELICLKFCINYQYKIEPEAEYLVIRFEIDLVLDNFWWLRHQNIEPKKAHKLKKEITIEANSALVFVTYR